MEREMKKYTCEVVKETVQILAKEFGFEYEKGLELLGLEEARMKKKEKTEKTGKTGKKEKPVKTTPKFPLPFTGDIKKNWCQAMKQNHGLFSQCTNGPEAEETLCKTCKNQTAKKGQPTCGYIQARLECDLMDYEDEKGKKVVTYGAVLKKLNISRAEAEAEANKFEILIPDAQFEIPPKKSGRPKKEKKVESGSTNENKLASADAADSLIASLVAEAQKIKPKEPVTVQPAETEEPAEAEEPAEPAAPVIVATKRTVKKTVDPEKVTKKSQQEAEKATKKAQQEAEKATKKAQLEAEKATKKAQQEAEKATKKEQAKKVPETVELEMEDEDEDNSISVKKFEFEGKIYLRSSDDVIYDLKTEEPIGMWNEEEKCIDEIETEED